MRTPWYWLKRWCRRMKWYNREFCHFYDAQFDMTFPVRRYRAKFQRDVRRGILDERGNLIESATEPRP